MYSQIENKLCLIQFNEANIELVKKYLNNEQPNRWPNLRKLTELKTISTSSENKYEYLEPWIQWTSVHTGLSAEEHGVFRLGDIKNFKGIQVFEKLEESGISVGSISAMNAENRLQKPAYFIPDPWTDTETDGSFFSEKVHQALRQSVNDNAAGKLTIKTIYFLLMALVLRTQLRNWPTYFKLAYKAMRRQKWCKALFLDLFLSDLHLSKYSKTRPQFTTVFFNGFAHIQHHYFFNSKFYDGLLKNPDWYAPPEIDPFFDALDIYEKIIKDHFRCFDHAEILVSTGLSQKAYDSEKFYYRLKTHDIFLQKIGIKGARVDPRMTRDFLLSFDSEASCLSALKILQKASIKNVPVFNHVDNRGTSLFVTLTYPYQLTSDSQIEVGLDVSLNALDEFVFVAVKNGMHDPCGTCFTTSTDDKIEKFNGQHVKGIYEYVLSRFVSV